MIITTAEAKAHMNITDASDDALIAGKIAAAESWASNYIGVPLASFPTLPADIREAVLRLAADFYENREASLVGVSAQDIAFGVVDLLRPYRSWEF